MARETPIVGLIKCKFLAEEARNALTFELGAECGCGVDRGSVRHWDFGTGRGVGADRCAGDRVYQCDDRAGVESDHFSADTFDARIVLVCHQRVDAGAGFGAFVTRISGAWVLRGICRRNRVEPGQPGVESHCDAVEGPAVDEGAQPPFDSARGRLRAESAQRDSFSDTSISWGLTSWA